MMALLYQEQQRNLFCVYKVHYRVIVNTNLECQESVYVSVMKTVVTELAKYTCKLDLVGVQVRLDKTGNDTAVDDTFFCGIVNTN
jgi:hypothetical protein